MRLSPLYLFLVIFALSALAVVSFARDAFAARDQYESAVFNQSLLCKKTQDILRLRETPANAQIYERPKQDMLAQLQAVLSTAGIPGDRFRELERDADVPVENATMAKNATLRRQSYRFMLGPVTPKEAGKFLVEWREAQPLWPIARLELLHKKDSTTDLYQLQVLVTATYVSDGFEGRKK